MNPPYIHWISAIPVWLARQIGARSDFVATFFTAAIAAVSLVVSDRLIASGTSADSAPRALLLIAAIVVLFAPGYDFGQREHWMVLLTLPYIIVRSRRTDDIAISNTAAALVGVAACLGFGIKPYYLLAPVVLEVWLLMRTRRPLVWIAPETIAMGVTGLVCLGFVLGYAPAYFGEELPKVLLSYWAFNSTLPEVLWAAVESATPAVVLGALGYAILGRGERIPTLAQAFAVAGVGFLVGAFLQVKAWSYHFLPAAVFLDLAAAVLLMNETVRSGANTIRLGALMLVVLIIGAGSPSVRELMRRFDDAGTTTRVERLAAVFRSHPGPNRTVAGFLTSPRDVYPAVIASGVKWAVPFCCDYLVAASVRADEAPADQRQAIKAAGLEQAERVVATIRAKRPGVIVVDAGKRKLGFGNRKFDYLPWLDAHTGFANILQHYREIGPVGRFRLFVRK